jgi:uncharacterized LabA/DUF88 family protein
MHFTKSERIAVLIDGPELRATVGGIGIDVDFKKLLELFQGAARVVRACFYYIEREDEEEHSLRPLVDWLDYNGYRTVACSGRETDGIGRRSNKNFLNVRLAVDALDGAASVDHVVIFSGDAVLGPVVDCLKDHGKRVSIVSTLQLRPPMIADELRRKADQFIDLADIIEHVAKDRPVTVVKRRRAPKASAAAVRAQSPVIPQKDEEASTS